MTYIQWVSITENESKYQRRQAQPWERLEKPPIQNPGRAQRQPLWMQKAVRTLPEVDEALRKYEESRQKENLKNVETTYTGWKKSPAFAEMMAVESRKLQVKPALDEMEHWFAIELRWLENCENWEVLASISQAAQSIIRFFPMIPELYRKALQETFVRSAPTSDPLYCMKWYKDSTAWTARVQQLGDNSNAAKSANALTVTWPGPGHLCVTEHKQWSEPFNRGIEFFKVDRDVFTHELLHWCTHENFKKYIEDNYEHRSDDYNFLKEGVTEWLKRHVTGDMANGGYPAEYEEAVYVTRAGKISAAQLAHAYLGGKDVETMIKRLLKAKTERCDRGIYNQLLLLFADKTPRLQNPAKNEDRKANLFKGFIEDGLTSQQVKAKTNQAWADAYQKYLDARK
jgi:hypothetical protein